MKEEKPENFPENSSGETKMFSENDVIQIGGESALGAGDSGGGVKVVRMSAKQKRIFPMPDIKIRSPIMRKGKRVSRKFIVSSLRINVGTVVLR